MHIQDQRKEKLNLITSAEKEYHSFKRNSNFIIRPFYRLYKYKFKYLNYLSRQFDIFAKRDINANSCWGAEITIPLKDVLFLPLSFFGLLSGLESRLAKYIVKNLKSDDIFYDIGANYGYYSVLAKELITDGEIHAFEPSPKTFTYLYDNVKPANNCVLNKLALSNINGEITFYNLFDGKFQSSGRSTMVGELASTAYKSEYKKIVVTSKTLDEYVSQHRKPTFIKLDVEGGEDAVLEGGKELLSENDSIVISMEVWGGEKGKKYSGKAIKRLYSYGYHPFRIDKEGELKKASGNLLSITENDFENYVFKK